MTIDTHSVMYITKRPELVFDEGHGSWLVDQNGKKYLDFLQGWAVNCLGHSNPGMIEAIEKQAKKVINPSPAFYNGPMIALSDLLTANSCFDKVFFANSGAEANEGAIKLARKWGKLHKNHAYEIITFNHAFHGRTIATMSASGKEGWDNMFAPQVSGFPKAELNDIESVKKLINDKTVAIMLEPVQGEGGVIPADHQFMLDLREITKQHKILLIVDEVQAGCGRPVRCTGATRSGNHTRRVRPIARALRPRDRAVARRARAGPSAGLRRGADAAESRRAAATSADRCAHTDPI